jgi:hypothetical protein
MVNRMPTVEELFTDTHSRFMKNWTVITSLRQFVDAAVPVAAEVLAVQHGEFMNLLATDPEYSKIFSGGEKPISMELRQMMQALLTDNVMTNAHAAIDAASIVFAQSILDDDAYSY